MILKIDVEARKGPWPLESTGLYYPFSSFHPTGGRLLRFTTDWCEFSLRHSELVFADFPDCDIWQRAADPVIARLPKGGYHRSFEYRTANPHPAGPYRVSSRSTITQRPIWLSRRWRLARYPNSRPYPRMLLTDS